MVLFAIPYYGLTYFILPGLSQPISKAIIYASNSIAFLCWIIPAYIFAYNLKTKGMLNSIVFGACTILLIIPVFSYHSSPITEELLSFYGIFLFTAVSTSFLGGAIYDVIQIYKKKPLARRSNVTQNSMRILTRRYVYEEDRRYIE